MSILGKYDKQPREVEIYAFRFDEDMSATDEITGGYSALMVGTQPVREMETAVTYLAQLSDDGALIYAAATIMLPAAPPIGFSLAVSNTNQNAGIQVGAFNVAARSAIIVRATAAGYEIELATDCIIVSSPGDQRIRLRISGGIDKLKYKAQATAITAEGRVLEDEMILRIKED